MSLGDKVSKRKEEMCFCRERRVVIKKIFKKKILCKILCNYK